MAAEVGAKLTNMVYTHSMYKMERQFYFYGLRLPADSVLCRGYSGLSWSHDFLFMRVHDLSKKEAEKSQTGVLSLARGLDFVRDNEVRKRSGFHSI